MNKIGLIFKPRMTFLCLFIEYDINYKDNFNE